MSSWRNDRHREPIQRKGQDERQPIETGIERRRHTRQVQSPIRGRVVTIISLAPQQTQSQRHHLILSQCRHPVVDPLASIAIFLLLVISPRQIPHSESDDHAGVGQDRAPRGGVVQTRISSSLQPCTEDNRRRHTKRSRSREARMWTEADDSEQTVWMEVRGEEKKGAAMQCEFGDTVRQ